MGDKVKPSYGNWVSIRMMRLCSVGTIVFLILSILSFCPLPFLLHLPLGALMAIRILLSLVALLLLLSAVYMGVCRHLFSYDGGQVAAKILDYVLEHLDWDGNGALLDIGCGSGALTIRAAKKFPDAALTGIDYWGAIWNFAKEQCEQNAQAEGVGKRIVFQKGDAASLPFPGESFDAVVSNFVFHEVRSQPDKRLVVKEALRVVKKGGVFAFHDLFLQKSLYGDMQAFVNELKAEGISEIHFVCSRDERFIPGIMKTPTMLGNIGLLYGRK